MKQSTSFPFLLLRSNLRLLLFARARHLALKHVPTHILWLFLRADHNLVKWYVQSQENISLFRLSVIILYITKRILYAYLSSSLKLLIKHILNCTIILTDIVYRSLNFNYFLVKKQKLRNKQNNQLNKFKLNESLLIFFLWNFS